MSIRVDALVEIGKRNGGCAKHQHENTFFVKLPCRINTCFASYIQCFYRLFGICSLLNFVYLFHYVVLLCVYIFYYLFICYCYYFVCICV